MSRENPSKAYNQRLLRYKSRQLRNLRGSLKIFSKSESQKCKGSREEDLSVVLEAELEVKILTSKDHPPALKLVKTLSSVLIKTLATENSEELVVVEEEESDMQVIYHNQERFQVLSEGCFF